VVPVNRLMDMAKTETPVEPTTRECPECLSKIPIKARRCAFCTTVLASAEAGDGQVAAAAR
jgi:large conductance mechanosensitive channel